MKAGMRSVDSSTDGGQSAKWARSFLEPGTYPGDRSAGVVAEGRRAGGLPVRRLTMLAVVGVLVGACASPQVEVFPSPDTSLAARPSVTATTTRSPTPRPDTTAPAPTGTASPSGEPSLQPAVEDTTTDEQPIDTPVATDPAVPTPFRPIGGINDPQGDLPRGAPGWVDIIGLVLEDDGTTLRIRIDVADKLPEALRNKETAQIGVDLFRGDDGETRYRIFVDGNDEGWFAYFQHHDGFVAFPGAVTVRGSTLAFTVPSDAVGDPVRGDWRAFSEWSDPGGGRRQAHDSAPDEGWGTFSR